MMLERLKRPLQNGKFGESGPPPEINQQAEHVMGIVAYCPNGHRLKVKDEFAGKRVLCPNCQAKVRIPASVASATPLTSATAGGLQTARLLELDPAVIATLPRALPFGQLPTTAETMPAPVAVEPFAPDPFSEPAQQTHWHQEPVHQEPLSAEPMPPQTFLHPAIASQPGLCWRIALPGSEPTEPLAAETMQTWLDSRQATGTEMVWRSDWPEWMPGRDVFPEYFP